MLQRRTRGGSAAAGVRERLLCRRAQLVRELCGVELFSALSSAGHVLQMRRTGAAFSASNIVSARPSLHGRILDVRSAPQSKAPQPAGSRRAVHRSRVRADRVQPADADSSLATEHMQASKASPDGVSTPADKQPLVSSTLDVSSDAGQDGSPHGKDFLTSSQRCAKCC